MFPISKSSNQGVLRLQGGMEVKEEPDSFYDRRLEPDVILIDSEESNNSSSMKDRRTSTSPRGGGDSPLQECPTCHKFFKRISSHMLTHITLENDPERPFPCSYCPKVFKNLSNLTIHTRSHTGFKPYICEVCQKGFTQSGNLVHHLRIHTGSRPYKCPICDRGFTQPGNLGNHMRLHNQEKPFRCHICDRSFTQSSNLNSHIRNNHKDFAQVAMLAKLELMRNELNNLTKTAADADIKNHI